MLLILVGDIEKLERRSCSLYVSLMNKLINMVLYNVTVSVEQSIKDDWLTWMKEVHVPEVVETGVFIKARIHRILSESDSDNTFAISYTCRSMQDFRQYQIEFASDLQKKHIDRYGDKVIAFRTLMEVIADF